MDNSRERKEFHNEDHLAQVDGKIVMTQLAITMINIEEFKEHQRLSLLEKTYGIQIEDK